jgi:NAD(P)-dependent dehydrogenase (short-subunit alcohol dehydrogenase family)
MDKNSDLTAVVTGASRGIGKGIALALGRRGATVYVAGRTQVVGTQTSPGGAPVPGSIYEAAEEVTRVGGRGIAVATDMADDAQIKALFEQVRRDSGHLNILVNNAAYLNEEMFVRPFWEAPVELANIIDVGLRCHHVATYYAAPLLIAKRRGLIVNISFYGDANVHDPAYYASKAGLDKLAAVYAEHFRPFGVAAVSLWPGYVATERLLTMAETDTGTQQLRDKFGLESTEFSGRVIAALYDDPDLLTLSGKTLINAEIAERYGVKDLDGYTPRSLRADYGGPHPAFDAEGGFTESPRTRRRLIAIRAVSQTPNHNVHASLRS